MQTFNQLFSSAPPIHTTPETSKSHITPPEKPYEEEKPKTKKKLKFKK
jgi:hypothetical protein